jgi:hypothetical protein
VLEEYAAAPVTSQSPLRDIAMEPKAPVFWLLIAVGMGDTVIWKVTSCAGMREMVAEAAARTI